MTTLDEIQARADAATEGPWYQSPLGEVYSGLGMSNDPLVADEMFSHDAEFIAHAREDVPKLAKAVREVETIMDQLDIDRADGRLVTIREIQQAVRDAIQQALGG